MNTKTENHLILMLTIIALALGAFFGVHQLIEYYQSATNQLVAIFMIIIYLSVVPLAFFGVVGIIIRGLVWGLSAILSKQ